MIESIKLWWYDHQASVYAKRLGRLQAVRGLLTDEEYEMFSEPLWAKLAQYIGLANCIKRRHIGAL